MSTRKRFIRHAAVCLLPHTGWNVEKAVHWGEKLWQRLNERGLGDARPSGPRPQQNWYARLNAAQRRKFDQFWEAYGHKVGKQNAAMRWLQLDPSDTLTGHIVQSAARERERARNDGATIRKHPQGWLTERRWEDHEPPQKRQQDQQRARLAELRAEAAGLRSLLKMKPDPAIEQQLDALEKQIEAHHP